MGVLMKCYIAGPLFTDGDRWYLEKIDQECKHLGIDTYLPHRDAGLCPSNQKDTRYYFEADFQNVVNCDFMLAVLHGTDVDSGTAWEIGCAYANGKRIIAIADDIRVAGIMANVNLMISNSTKIVFSFSQLIEELSGLVQMSEREKLCL